MECDGHQQEVPGVLSGRYLAQDAPSTDLGETSGETGLEGLAEVFRGRVKRHFSALRSRGISANYAAALAMKIASGTVPQPAELNSLLEMLCEAKRTGSVRELVPHIAAAFSSLDIMNCTFAVSPRSSEASAEDDGTTKQTDAVGQVYRELIALQSAEVLQAMMGASSALVDELLISLRQHNLPPGSTHVTGPLLVLLENPLLREPEHALLLSKLCEVAASLPRGPQLALVLELQRLSKPQFEHLIAVVQQFVTARLYEGQHIDSAVEAATKLLGLLYEANEKVHLVGYSSFYNDAVNNEDFNIRDDYRRWREPERGAEFSFCQHSFVYDPASKSRILQEDARRSMSDRFHEAMLQSIFVAPSCPFLVLRVRRDNLVHDTIAQVQGRSEELKKPLKVQFVGEDGVDEGGVQKEFFQLVIREVFDPKYGMFSYDEETRLFWFHSSPLDMDSEFELVGILVGLAIYNGHILEFRFPNVIYKKLLNKPETCSDLEEVSPGLARGLQQLLDFEGDVQDVFCRNFQVSVKDVFDDVLTVDLKDGGASVPVTEANRQEYVDLCVQYYLNKAIERPFSAFSRGLHRLCRGDILKLFQPEELEQLICGSPVLDFGALEQATMYEDGYTKESPVILDFWKVVHSMTEENKKRLLFFATGSDRVPIKGLSNLPFVISRNGSDSNRLPTAHTCFNHLLLPDYIGFDKLKERLLTAISNSEGFGLV